MENLFGEFDEIDEMKQYFYRAGRRDVIREILNEMGLETPYDDASDTVLKEAMILLLRAQKREVQAYKKAEKIRLAKVHAQCELFEVRKW